MGVVSVLVSREGMDFVCGSCGQYLFTGEINPPNKEFARLTARDGLHTAPPVVRRRLRRELLCFLH